MSTLTLRSLIAQTLRAAHTVRNDASGMPLAAGSALLALSIAGSAYAQQAPAKADATAGAATLDEIVVTGIRRSIEDAIQLKRDSDLVVEAISSEDIGKLPDVSIADSIARLPGLAAQRDQFGNATQISIRGMGPDFTGTTLNGREQTSSAQTRSVDYSAYPGELVSGVVVYKTPDAGLIGQGLAGTVNIRTVTPLSYNDMKIAVNARREKLGMGLPVKGRGSRVSASFIDQFFDHTFGVAVGVARLDDKGGTNDDSGTWGGGHMLYNGVTVKTPYGGLNENGDQSRQRRDGAMAVLQWKPSDRFESEVDWFYSKFHTNDQAWNLQMDLQGAHTTDYANPDGSTTHVIRQPLPVLTNAVVDANGNVTSGTITGIRPVIQNIGIGSQQQLRSLGWANTFKATDDLTLTADLNHNDAVNQNYNIETYASTPTKVGGLPVLTDITFNNQNLHIGSSLDLSNRANTVFTDVLGWSCCQADQPGYIKYPLTKDAMTAGKVSGTLKLSGSTMFSAIDFGVNYSNRSKSNETTEGYLWIKGSNGALYSNGGHIPGGGLSVAGESGLLVPTYDVFSTWQQFFDVGTRATPDILAKTWSVKEKTTTAFAKLDISSKLGEVPVRGNLGLQIVNTDQSSTAYSTNRVTNGNDALAGPPTLITRGAKSTQVLPSLNVVFELADEQTLRLSAARQMARPNMADMNASFSVRVAPGPTGQQIFNASGGNPLLKPFLAKALDVSYEKYFERQAYVSVAAFYKSLESYIVSTTDNSYDFTGQVGNYPAGTVSSNIGSFSRVVNGSGGRIDGVEFSGSFPLRMMADALDGFGVQGSWAITNSSINAPNATAGTTQLPGLSKNVGSFEAYFDKAGFQVRLAQRYRSAFIGSLITNFGVPGATYVRTEAPMDAQISYELQAGPAKGLQLQLQAQNLKNTPFRTSNSTTGAASSYKFGTTYLFGVNYKY